MFENKIGRREFLKYGKEAVIAAGLLGTGYLLSPFIEKRGKSNEGPVKTAEVSGVENLKPEEFLKKIEWDLKELDDDVEEYKGEVEANELYTKNLVLGKQKAENPKRKLQQLLDVQRVQNTYTQSLETNSKELFFEISKKFTGFKADGRVSEEQRQSLSEFENENFEPTRTKIYQNLQSIRGTTKEFDKNLDTLKPLLEKTPNSPVEQPAKQATKKKNPRDIA